MSAPVGAYKPEIPGVGQQHSESLSKASPSDQSGTPEQAREPGTAPAPRPPLAESLAVAAGIRTAPLMIYVPMRRSDLAEVNAMIEKIASSFADDWEDQVVVPITTQIPTYEPSRPISSNMPITSGS